MQLRGIYNSETIIFCEDDNQDNSHYVELTMDPDEPKFSVTYCCDNEWIWEFVYSKTHYEMVKHIVMDCAFLCETMEEAIEMMDEIFEEQFMDLVWDEDDGSYDLVECDGDCENCEMNV